MKKFLALILTVCMAASMLSMTALAADAPTDAETEPSVNSKTETETETETELPPPAPGVVLRVTALKKGESSPSVVIGDFNNFVTGWNTAMKLADNRNEMENNKYDRIVVDLYADWTAVKGEFSNSGTGFNWDAIYFQNGVRMTLNMNGHTIDRAMTTWEYNGEVMYIDTKADVIINNGTITGGWSCNGAGGIHINDDATVVLNDVHVTGNKVDDDDGAGIAIYDGATLTMNGGSVSHNVSYDDVYGGGVYINDAGAVFNKVTFENNQGTERSTLGSAVYVTDGTLVMDGCKIIGNGKTRASNGDARLVAFSIIDILRGSEVTLKNTTFSDNGNAQETHTDLNTVKYTAVIHIQASHLTMEKCAFTNNHQVYLIQSEASVLKATNSDFTGNQSFAFYGNCAGGYNSTFTNCSFSYSEPMLSLGDTFFFNVSNAGLTFKDCEFGDATFNQKSAAQFVDTDESNGSDLSAAFVGEGSVATILALVSLIAAIISICLTIGYNKGKALPAATDHASENEE